MDDDPGEKFSLINLNAFILKGSYILIEQAVIFLQCTCARLKFITSHIS